MDTIFAFGKLYELTNIGITVFQDGKLIHPGKIDEFYPIRDNAQLYELLVQRAGESDAPAIHMDAHKVAYGAYYYEGCHYFIGPVATEHLNHVELHRYYFEKGLRKGTERPLPVMGFHKFTSFVELVVLQISGLAFGNEQLNVDVKDLDEVQKALEHKKFDTLQEDENEYHHTYMDEKALLDCVREGRVEEALRLNARIDGQVGTMSKNVLSQWQKIVTVAIALGTRAAIDGGLSPQEAYRLSDYYTQKSDSCKTVPELIRCRNQAIKELTTRVHERQMRKGVSSYVERCCDYIGKHYREKIYLDDLAEQLGISPSYLSRLFVKEKGMKLQDYIVEIRVERAANLLMFSDESLAKIGDYVNFPSQSYFGKVFKKYKHMTPKEYRELYKPKEF